MNVKPSPFIVATDLDGTLLDHYTYEWHAALPAIKQLIHYNIPIVFNTSKTFDEASVLQAEMGISFPIIVENGSALVLDSKAKEMLLPIERNSFQQSGSYWIEKFGAYRKDILTFIQQQKDQYDYKIEGFNNWSVETLAEKTNLSIVAATHSKNKQYSEPFIWHGNDKEFEHFEQAANNSGLKILQGGRFYHLQGNTTKADPLEKLKHYYSKVYQQSPTLVCLGDNKNDVHMLDLADIPICIKSPTSPYPKIQENTNSIFTEEFGPKGWNQAILSLIDKYV